MIARLNTLPPNADKNADKTVAFKIGQRIVRIRVIRPAPESRAANRIGLGIFAIPPVRTLVMTGIAAATLARTMILGVPYILTPTDSIQRWFHTKI